MAKFEMNDFVHRWMQRRALVNMWRMPAWMSEADLVQEGQYCWTLVNDKYADVVTEVAHMVSLFKTTFHNHITDLAKNVRNPRGEVSLDALVEDAGDLSFLCDEPDINLIILDAPEPIQSILRLLTSSTERIFTAPNRVYLDGRRDTVNNRIHRALARRGIELEPTTDILRLVQDYLKPRRVRLHEEPSVVDVVSALVDEHLWPAHRAKPQRQRLCYAPHLTKAAKAKVKDYLKPKSRRRARMFPVVEVKSVNRDHTQAGVRCRASDPQPRQQVSQPAWPSVRSRVHGDWKDCHYVGRERRGDADRLRDAEVDHEQRDCGTVGPRAPAMGRRPNAHCTRRAVGEGPAIHAPGGPQNGATAVHTNGREPRSVRVRRTGHTSTSTRAAADTRAAL